MSVTFDILRELSTQNGQAAATMEFPPLGESRERPIESASTSLITLRAKAEIEKLVQRVFLSGNKNNIVLFCGIDQPAGCSSLCARTAENLASQVSGTVCIVNGSSETGSYDPLHANLAAETSVVTEQISRKVWRVAAGSLCSGIDISARAEALRARLLQLAGRFTYVLIESPPICSENDSALLAQLVSGVVLIAEAHKTRRAAALKAKQILESVNARLLGTVLNNRTFPIPEKLYRKL